jgi:hypothetical protein
VEHQSVDESLDNWALCLSEFENLVLSSGMWNKHLGLATLKGYMISKDQPRLLGSFFLIPFLFTKIFKLVFATIVFPFAEQLGLYSE